jgi:hypothetical protein
VFSVPRVRAGLRRGAVRVSRVIDAPVHDGLGYSRWWGESEGCAQSRYVVDGGVGAECPAEDGAQGVVVVGVGEVDGLGCGGGGGPRDITSSDTHPQCAVPGIP